MKQPANDVCIQLEFHQSLDVVWNVPRSRWSVWLRGRRIGHAPTRRLAKKLGKRAAGLA